MATIKTQITESVRRILTKTVDGNKRVSCSCCECFCNLFDCSNLTPAFREAIKPNRADNSIPIPSNIDISYYDQDNIEQVINGTLTVHGQGGTGWTTNAGKPSAVSFYLAQYDATIWAGWTRSPFCFRFICRIIDDTSENGTVVCSVLNCGPSLNEINLTEELFSFLGQRPTKRNLLTTEIQSGIYIYAFEFFGWKKPQWDELLLTTQSVPRDDAYYLYSFFNNLE